MRAGVLAAWMGCLLPFAASAGTAPAGTPPAGTAPTTWLWAGTLGTQSIGASLTIVDAHTFVAGHYFYDRFLTDIPLTGAVRGTDVELREPGGGAFELHLASHAPGGGPARDFDTATDLDGTWTRGHTTLPVTLRLASASEAKAANGRGYGDVTAATDAAFETRVQRFIAAVLAGDRAAAAGLVSYPLRVNGPGGFSVSTPAALRARWTDIFTPPVIAALRRAVPHDMFVHDGLAMIGDGEVWFDAHGVAQIYRAGPPGSG